MKSFYVYKLLLLFCAVSLFCISLQAKNQQLSNLEKQSANAELDKIFAAAINSVGDQKEINKIRSIESFADCIGPRGKYTTEVISYLDGKTIFKQKFAAPNREPVNIYVNDETGWEKSEKTNEVSIISDVEKSIARAHEFQLMAFDFQKRFRDFSIEGVEDFEKRQSIKVRTKNDLGNTVYLFFDTETKLLSGNIMLLPGSNETVKIVFNEWRKIGKVKLPSVVTATDNRGDYVLRFHTITLNKTAVKTFDIPPLARDLSELLRQHELQKTAHLTYNAELLVGDSEEQPTTLQRGAVTTKTRAENLARVKAYFGNYKFLEWEDIKPPIIKVSKDGSMATVIIQKRVRGTYKDKKGQEQLGHTEFAWLEIWEKVSGKWKLTTIASTEKVIENGK